MIRRAIPTMVFLATMLAVLGTGWTAEPPTASQGVVNVNTATVEQLQLLPRVGPALAGRIVEFREANGPFESIDELVAVRGIGEKSLEKLRPHVTVKGPTTLEEKIRLPRRSKKAAPETKS